MRVLLSFSIILCSISCSSNENPRSGGVCISFDDRNVSSWYENRKLFSDNNIPVTYFVTQPDSLTHEEISMLLELQQEGNEIGFHGNLHVVSEYYIKENGYSTYLTKEIDNGLKIMDSLGFRCQSFAYPFGAKYWLTDFILSDTFNTLRGVAVKRHLQLSDLDDIYYDFDGSAKKFALDISNLAMTDSVEIVKALDRAEREGTVIQFFGHQLSASSKEVIQLIVNEGVEKDMEFYKYQDM